MRTVTHRILRTDFMALAKDSFKRRAGCCGCTSCEINRYARPCCGIESCCCCFRPCRPEGKWDMAVEYADETDEVCAFGCGPWCCYFCLLLLWF